MQNIHLKQVVRNPFHGKANSEASLTIQVRKKKLTELSYAGSLKATFKNESLIDFRL